MTKKEENKKALLLAFQNADFLSTKQIMDILKTPSKGTVNTYIGYLKKDGYSIEEEILSRGAKNYRIKPSDEYKYDEITKRDWQNFVICSALYDLIGADTGVTRMDLIQYILEDKELNLDLKKTSLFSRINELCADGTIYENTATNPTTLLPGAAMQRIEGLSLDDAAELTKHLSMLPSTDPFYGTVSSIKDSLLKLSDMVNIIEPPPSFMALGKKYEEKSISTVISEHFKDCNYKKYLCDITYRGKKRDSSSTMRVAVGLIVYVTEKDNIYVIGDAYYDDNRSEKIILQIDRIVSASDAKEVNEKIPNPCWNTSEFRQIYEEMLSISTENAQDVRIRFDDKYYIENKLDVVVKQRRSAKLEHKDGYLEYTDKIRGLSDLRNYLRSFNEQCVIFEPAELRNDMINGLKRHLRIYGETS